MKIARLASLTLVAIMAIGLAVASVAAAAPEFNPTGATITGLSNGTSVLSGDGEEVSCAKNSATGTVTSATLVGGIIIHFLECTGKTTSGATCPVMSSGQSVENLILTTTLHGVLGLILPKPETGSDVALVLLPVNGPRFVTLLGSCIEETAVSGSVAGLVGTVGSPVTQNLLTLGVTGGVQNIKDVDLSTGGLVAPKLTAFTATATEAAMDTIDFSKATEVT